MRSASNPGGSRLPSFPHDHTNDNCLHDQGLGAAATEIRQLEANLAEADAERTEARTRYMRLGDKVEALLQAEAHARSAAERDRGAARLAVQVCSLRLQTQPLM